MQPVKLGFSDEAKAALRSRRGNRDKFVLSGWMKTVCRDKHGNIKWVDEGPNLVVNEGIDYILTNDLAGATLYLGLTEASPSPAAGNTMSSHAGWDEAAGYDEANRVSWGQGEPSSQAVTNGTAAEFTMDGNDTSIGGAFITTDNTKDGTSGTLIAVKAFTGGNKTVADNDVLSVTYTITGSSS